MTNLDTIREALRRAPVTYDIGTILTLSENGDGWKWRCGGTTRDCNDQWAKTAMIAAWVEWLIKKHAVMISMVDGTGVVIRLPGASIDRPRIIEAPDLLHALAAAVVAVGEGKEGT